ncbi:MAG: carboxypeptidase-like regulatory domain-containing protein, partial [Bacteroidota bacterium]
LFLLAQNAKNNRVKLNSYKNKFNDQFFEDFIAMIEAAQALPGEQARAIEHESLRVDLTGFSRTSHKQWQMLKGYIEEAFPEDKWIMNFDSAGWQYYDSTSWDAVSEMNNMAVSYLNLNQTKLETDGYMNPSFISETTLASETFSNGLQAFLLAEENARAGTILKLTKSNEAFSAGMSICKTGTIVANNEENPAMAEQFSFEALVALVKPATASALVVDITNSETEMPLAGAQLTITGSNKTGTSNGEGRIEIGQLPAETINGTITADGFTQQPFTATLTGVTTRIKMVMKPMFTGEMKVGSESGSQQSAESSGQMAGVNQ